VEVFYRYDRRNLRGQNTFCDSGKALGTYPDQNLRQQAGQSWIQRHHTGKGFISGQNALAKGCSDLLEGAVLKQTGKEQIAGLEQR
jgi:hypothetical protein